MDQQLERYQQRIEKTWKKVKSSVLVRFSKRDRVLLLIITGLLLWFYGFGLYDDIQFVLFQINTPEYNDFSIPENLYYLIYGLYQLILPVLTLVGAVYLVLSKPRGWVLVLCNLCVSIIYMVAQIISSLSIYFQARGPVTGILLDLDNQFFPSLRTLLVTFVIYILLVGYFFSKPIKEGFGIKRKQVLTSFGIMAIFLIVDAVFNLLLI